MNVTDILYIFLMKMPIYVTVGQVRKGQGVFLAMMLA